ncbi:hypothetical protein [Blastomonas sp. AAP53]|uniref:hypothetical protein n=1 Tax=Blastomonas sp. AAP53 TaxID=1248760 RepID=UPI00126725CA|nr:hypothetical protein [Blastomonas sp. AAP53]
MRSDIRNVRFLAKYGAFGNPNAVGFYVYGKRRDGRTVACKTKTQENGSVIVFSTYFGLREYAEYDETEFTSDEWQNIKKAGNEYGAAICNKILDTRRS